MARPGFGKRSAPGQAPRRADDFAHLPAREASVAGYLDRLPEGAAMDVKTLAKELAAYGQQAIRTALQYLVQAGHLLRRREPVGEGRTQWVFRTYFSRTPRNDAWWKRFLKGDAPPEQVDATPGPEPVPALEAEPVRAQPPAARSRAYKALAMLGRTGDRRLTLSASECAQLEPLVTEWFARGAVEADVVRAVSSGLPLEVHCAGAFARRRLIDKIPPEPFHEPADPPGPVPAEKVECRTCRVPGPPEAFTEGLCRACLPPSPYEGDGGATADADADAERDEDVRRRVAGLRASLVRRRPGDALSRKATRKWGVTPARPAQRDRGLQGPAL
ncbi:hypothetical protein [Streptomyces roseoverticillatus]|uniref:hypothetical protein n=1 Tax=Streptomyces roseoverticillatus TaxID=66429 RepID=UPI001FE1130F|nr:hypothetical protein [Streptomyces roseoverticillatus]